MKWKLSCQFNRTGSILNGTKELTLSLLRFLRTLADRGDRHAGANENGLYYCSCASADAGRTITAPARARFHLCAPPEIQDLHSEYIYICGQPMKFLAFTFVHPTTSAPSYL